MEVTLQTSGALNRKHYALVQQVEATNSLQQVDTLLIHEIDGIRRRFAREILPSAEEEECLILLMYCSMMLNFGLPTPNYLEFSLAHAVKLAESGQNFRNRRTGYQYCTQHMHPNHELNLLLVNTIRKDLETHDEPRMAVALDYIVQSPNIDVIPAVQSRLRSLLSHRSPNIRRRTIRAFNALSSLDPSMLDAPLTRITKRENDSELGVASAALSLLIADCKFNRRDAGDVVQALLGRMKEAKLPLWMLVRTLGELLRSDPSSRSNSALCGVLIDVLKGQKKPHPLATAIMLEAFRALSNISTAVIISSFSVSTLSDQSSSSGNTNPVVFCRPLLASQDPNSQYAFLACLLHLDPSIWTGTLHTGPDHPVEAVLMEEEVLRVMSFLESSDACIRNMTIKILMKVDSNIVSMYYDRLLGSLTPGKPVTLPMAERHASRLLEIAQIMSASGSEYAVCVTTILAKVQRLALASEGGKKRATFFTPNDVLEGAVESILLHVHDHSKKFQHEFVDNLVMAFSESTPLTSTKTNIEDNTTSKFGPTATIIIAATLAEYGALLATPPEQSLSVLQGPLQSSSPAIQEALLIAMLRLAARCENVPEQVTGTVRTLSLASRRHMQSRCQQFLTLVARPTDLQQVVSSAKSSFLPDFLAAIEMYFSKPQQMTPSQEKRPTSTQPPPTSPPRSNSSAAMSSSKLRYDAYAVPTPVPRRGISRARSDSRSTAGSMASSSTSPRTRWQRGVEDVDAEDPMSRTVTAGELALAGEDPKFWASKLASPTPQPRHEIQTGFSPVAEQLELIALDSPFRTEPPQSLASLADHHPVTVTNAASIKTRGPITRDNFNATWSGLAGPKTTLRGWSSSTPDVIAQRLNSMDDAIEACVVEAEAHDPFIEDDIETLVVLRSRHASSLFALAAARLKHGDDGSCLWMLRCHDEQLMDRLRLILNDSD